LILQQNLEVNIHSSLKIFYSKNGNLNFLKDGISFHSHINPTREVQRFLKISIKRKPSAIIILGETAGHISRECKILYPYACILAIYPQSHPAFISMLADQNTSFEKDYQSIRQFIIKRINPLYLKRLEIVTWNPVLRAYPKQAHTMVKAVQDAVTIIQRNIHTTMYFGKRWLHNIIKNYLLIDEHIYLEKIQRPILITASGPSLEDAYPFIKKYRKYFFLLSTSSSLLFLSEKDIYPDLTIHTDGGYWSMRYIQNYSFPIAAPLTAALGKKQSLMEFTQNSLLEDIFNTHSKYIIPEHGTVSGSAVLLALQLCSEAIVLAGLDFSSQDILMHARPHQLDSYYVRNSCRKSPEELLRYKHNSEIIHGASLQLYENWFTYNLPLIAENRIYCLASNYFQGSFPIYHPSFRSTSSKGWQLEKKKVATRPIRRKLLQKKLHIVRQLLIEEESNKVQDLLLHLYPQFWEHADQGITKSDRKKAISTLDLVEKKYLL